MTRLEGLLAQRNNRYDNMDYDSIKISSVAKDSPDMLFINNLVEIIEENMLNVDLDMPFLCEKLAMSHISMYRKVKAITGYNVNTFIREIRLKKAAQMLRIPGYSVTDVMYDVGFNHRSYFSKCFKEYFGVSPKDYAKKYQTKENNI